MSGVNSESEYVIVDFPDESKNGIISMALVSSTWLFESNRVMYCYWPTYLKSTLSRERAVKLHTPLHIDKCIKCVIQVKYYDADYDRAMSKLRSLEEETESSNTDGGKQTINRPPHRLSDYVYYNETDEDENSIEVPVPPKFPSVKVNKTTKPCQKPITSDVDQLEQCSQPSSPKCQCDKNYNILVRVLRDLQIIKANLKDLMTISQADKLPQLQMLDEQFSFSSYEELLNFNNKLGEQDYFNKMQATISLLGGRDVHDTTRKIANCLISHELVLKLNWIGANEKGSLQKLEQLLKLIYGAARRNPICANSTNSEIDISLRNWIKMLLIGGGGRTNRKKNVNGP